MHGSARLGLSAAARAVVCALLLPGLAPSTHDAHGADPSAESIRFSRDIRPILSQNCFLCHGQDEARRGGGLRLDEREHALAETDSGLHAIVPGAPEESELVARITAEDESLRMPPADSHKTLTERQIELLSRWVAEGAEYEPHWSFIPPKQPAVPDSANAGGTPRGNPIDIFVQAKLKAEGLSLSKEADKRTLIRRLTLDLTGLPPSEQEIHEFLADERPEAYERLLDRLLASPRFGERMALDWLDAARYADTHGYHIDSHRDMWPWRDWVIRSFNENLPFDKFTVWQLAGDLLPEATVEQQTASGFNRNHPINFEGGAIPEEYHVEYVVDRVTTTGAVWLGLTMGCARCHDHKYDPITQKEFFEFFAFFNNVDEAGLDGYRGNAKPMLPLPTDQQRQRIDELTAEIADFERRLAEREPQLIEAQKAWEESLRDGLAVAGGGDAVDTGRPGRAGKVTPGDWLQLGPIVVERPELGLEDDFGIISPVSLKETATDQERTHTWQPAPRHIDGRPSNTSIFSFNGDAAVVYLLRHLDADVARTIRVYVGTSDAIEVRLNGQLLYERREQAPFASRQHSIELPLAEGRNELLVKLVNYAWDWEFQLGFDPRDGIEAPPNVLKLLEIPADKRKPDEAAALSAYFRECQCDDREYQSQLDQLAARKQELAILHLRIPTTMVMNERAEPRKTFRLERGQYNAPAEELSPRTPAALPPLPAGEPANRLTLARWLVSRDHPLTARVAVNRLWQMLFGVGIVKTSEDFGLQGQFPANPDLLDWLAVEFIESGWDVKHMIRLMASSAAYRQQSSAAPELYARDPDNQLLARGPRFRLPAEFIRDLALSTSGLLDDRIGGPSVKPYQPGDLWGELAHQKHNHRFTAQLFEQDHGADLYRRSMYTFWKRSVPPVNLAALDAPSREVCTVRRERTNTPLQALVLLNDPTFVEAARHLAERMIERGGDDPKACIDLAFERVTARLPTAQEQAVLLAEFDRQRQSFSGDPAAAVELLQVGESPRNESLDPVDHAALTSVALLILNLDEAITRN